MASAAVLICTTLISTFGNVTTATQHCREVASPIAETVPSQNSTVISMEPPPPTLIEGVAKGVKTKQLPAKEVEERALASTSSELSPRLAKPEKRKRVKGANKAPKRKLRKSPRRLSVTRDSNRFALPQKPSQELNLWGKLTAIFN